MTGWPAGRAKDGGIDEIPLPGPGRLWLCGKHYIAPAPDAALDATGATLVVCLCEETELAQRYPDYVRWLGADSRAMWVPIPDLHAPRVDEAARLVSAIGDRIDAGGGVIVHCGAGIGRAGTIAVAVLLALGTPLAAALGLVADHRPTAGPEAGAQQNFLEVLAGRPPRRLCD